MYKSETSKVRHLVEEYVKGDVIDVGFGGDPIVPHAITCDLPNPYAHTGTAKVDVPCDVSKGIPLEDNMFDTVYSSHLIEDFEDTKAILKEFIRITKDGGTLILVFPDQEKFEAHCKATGQPTNSNHKIKEMGLKYMEKQLGKLNRNRFFVSNCEIDYNVIMVLRINK